MRLKILMSGLAIVFLPFLADAQTKTKTEIKKKGPGKEKIIQASGTTKIERDKDGTTTVKMESLDGHEAKVKIAPPKWALSQGYLNDRHVYFPDYHLFYTPARGYVYWEDGRWINSAEVPAYMKGVDLRRAKAQILEEDGNGFPERNYRALKQQYPAEPVTVSVPVPAE